MAYWLLKTEPEEYSFDDLVRDRRGEWDGVRNHLARNHLAAMKPGDECLIYHTGKARVVVGTAVVVRAAYPDPTADDPRWLAVALESGRRLPVPVPLAAMRSEEALAGMDILKQTRLSVCPVSAREWRTILRLARGAPAHKPARRKATGERP